MLVISVGMVGAQHDNKEYETVNPANARERYKKRMSSGSRL